MNTEVFKVKKVHPHAKLPTKATPFAAGYDLYTPEDVTVYPGHKLRIDLGIKISIPEGHALIIKEKSGISLKHGLLILAGVIDSDYRGELAVVYYNPNGYNVMFSQGEKIAQGLLVPIKSMPVEEVETLDDTIRNENGFGSSGAY